MQFAVYTTRQKIHFGSKGYKRFLFLNDAIFNGFTPSVQTRFVVLDTNCHFG